MKTAELVSTAVLPPDRPDANGFALTAMPEKGLNEALKAKIDTHLADTGESQAELAHQIGVSESQLSRARRGKFTGDLAALEAKIKDFFVRFELISRVDGEVEPFTTLVTRQMGKYLELIQEERKLGLIHGRAGIGKSVGAREYLAHHPSALLVTANRPDGGGALNIVGHLWRQLDTRGHNKNEETRGGFLLRSLSRSNRLVIVDEAHELSPVGRAWICGLHRQTGCPVALVGNPIVLEQFKRLDQQMSLIVFEAECDLVRKTGGHKRDTLVEAARGYVTRAWPEAAPAIESQAVQIVEHRGALRALRHVVSIAKRLIRLGETKDFVEAIHQAHEMTPRDFDLTLSTQ